MWRLLESIARRVVWRLAGGFFLRLLDIEDFDSVSELKHLTVSRGDGAARARCLERRSCFVSFDGVAASTSVYLYRMLSRSS